VNRRTLLLGLASGALTQGLAAQPQPGKIAHIGILSMRRPGDSTLGQIALMQGLRERGYVEGRNLQIERPDALGREDLFPELAADLVRKKVDLILIIGPAPLAAARNATTTIPLVMVASSSDPVAEGAAVSLNRPGGNVTGLTYGESDRFKKQLEQLKTVATRITRIAVLWDFDVEHFRRYWQVPLAEASRVLGLQMQEPIRVRTADELPAAFATMKQRQADAFVIASGGFLLAAREQVAALALQHRMPGIAAFREFPQAGLLMSYGPDLPDINRRAGDYVDRILKGAKPGELAIQLPSRFEFVVNATTASALGLTIPQSVLQRGGEIVR